MEEELYGIASTGEMVPLLSVKALDDLLDGVADDAARVEELFDELETLFKVGRPRRQASDEEFTAFFDRRNKIVIDIEVIFRRLGWGQSYEKYLVSPVNSRKLVANMRHRAALAKKNSK